MHFTKSALIFKLTFLLSIAMPNPGEAKNIPGWSKSGTVLKNVQSYSVAENSMVRGSGCIASEVTMGNRHAIYFQNFDKGIAGTPEEVFVTDSGVADQPFLYPAVACTAQKDVIAWQNLSGDSSMIDFAIISKNDRQISRHSLKTSTSSMLPVLVSDRGGRIYLILQQKSGKRNFNLSLSTLDQGDEFTEPREVIQNISSLGRGVFFPSGVIHNSSLEIYFQKRYEKSIRDNIYRTIINLNDLSAVKTEALTDNDFNDFSPHATATPNGVEFVWQSSPDKGWQIWHSNYSLVKTSITRDSSNVYQPRIIFVPGAGRVIVWTDFRESEPKIYGIFVDRKENRFLGVPHDISGIPAFDPKTVRIGKSGFLFFRSGNTLLYKFVDISAPKLRLSMHSKPGTGLVTLKWDGADVNDVDQYAYMLDTLPSTNPDIFNLHGARQSISFDNLESGVYWFHIKYSDKAGNVSPVSHIRFSYNVDTKTFTALRARTLKKAATVVMKEQSFPVPELKLSRVNENYTIQFINKEKYNVIYSLNSKKLYPAGGNITGDDRVSLEPQAPGKMYFNAAYQAKDSKSEFSFASIEINFSKPQQKTWSVRFMFYTGLGAVILILLGAFRKRLYWQFSKIRGKF